MVIFTGACTDSELNTGKGKESTETFSVENTFSQNCASCHGMDGKLGSGGAFDLSKSQLPWEETKQMILKGTSLMPPFAYIFKDTLGLKETIEFVISLREN